ncbi:MAG TPA: UDP-N-acetylmuramoyl-L-alanine--D-glutamate ligase [Xanthobacteraceae bacterium]|nr:UDP-N-acetylmuramoyl-L-alanine--D-glutamate ligase [Xanthobacteraceae bacterium]
MIPVTTFAGKKVAVFGLGGSGLVSASALLAGGADVVAYDDNAQSVAKANAAGIPTADLRDVDWSKIAALVLAPGVPLTHPAPHWIVQLARQAGVAIIGDIELFCRERGKLAPGAPFVAITGTNGKSTTTALIAHLAASAGMDAQLGGNIGTAILSLLPPLAGRVHVIECSSYQIDLAPSLDPSVGILINLSEDHLDRHGTMAHYAEVKERLVAGVPSNGTAIVGVDDDWCRAIADRLARAGERVVRISVRQELSDGIYVANGRIMRATASGVTPIAELGGIGSLRGQHNAQNAACAAAAALALGLEPAAIQAGLRSFPGLAHRMEELGRRGAVLYVNDSKATNADSAAQALACFSDIFWIAGGKPKTGGIESLRGFFPRIRKAYLIGEAAEEFAATLSPGVPHEIDGTLDKALAAATRDAEASTVPEPVVLLSPASASFDQYRNFEVRGDAFRDLVRALPGLVPVKR